MAQGVREQAARSPDTSRRGSGLGPGFHPPLVCLGSPPPGSPTQGSPRPRQAAVAPADLRSPAASGAAKAAAEAAGGLSLRGLLGPRERVVGTRDHSDAAGDYGIKGDT